MLMPNETKCWKIHKIPQNCGSHVHIILKQCLLLRVQDQQDLTAAIQPLSASLSGYHTGHGYGALAAYLSALMSPVWHE